MKLIDILVEELPKRGGWPEGGAFVAQEEGGDLYSFTSKPLKDCDDEWMDESSCGYHKKVGKLPEASDHDTSTITREQYEAALAAKNDGWIEWGGGKCSVPGDTEVLIRCKSEGLWDYRRKQRADEVSWTHDDSNLDVIAYRLHQPRQAEHSEAGEEDLNECTGQAPELVWNGEGFPPVGMEIEYRFAKANYRTDFSRGKVLAYGIHNVFMEHWASKNEFIQPLDKIEFRPLRTESERKRYAAIESLFAVLDAGVSTSQDAIDVYDAIAAGKIPGVKLEV